MPRTTWILSFLAATAVFALAQDPLWPPKGTTCGDSVVAFYEAGPNFSKAMEVYPRHATYLGVLLSEGKIAGAGRMKDGASALVITRTPKLEEAQALIDADPFVKEGVVKASYHIWGHCWGAGVPAPDLAPETKK
jgi:uncharacterized protein YciI